MSDKSARKPLREPIARTLLAKGITGGCTCLPGQCKASSAKNCANWTKRKQDKRP